jgi:hypothetical protein
MRVLSHHQRAGYRAGADHQPRGHRLTAPGPAPSGVCVPVEQRQVQRPAATRSAKSQMKTADHPLTVADIGSKLGG